MKGIVYNEELLKELTGSDRVKVLTEKKYSELLEELDKLEKKLAIATDALSMLAHLRKEFDNRYREFAENALKQIEEVK